MSLESDLFARLAPVEAALIKYGFKKENQQYIYRQMFLDDEFEAEIIVDEKVTGHVYDSFSHDEYTLIHMNQQKGSYVAQVKGAYVQILEDIAKKCFKPTTFIMGQSNRLEKYIDENYHRKAEFLWKEDKRHQDHAVFRHNNNKWFALIMYIAKDKITEGHEMVEVLNLKVGEDNLAQYLDIEGIYPAYHMNKKNWISIILDDTLNDEVIESLIDLSYLLTRGSEKTNHKNWIVPAASGYFDIERYFEAPVVEWKQTTNIHIGDNVYIYVSAPYSCIMYKCEAVKVGLENPYSFNGKDKLMYLRPLKKYQRGRWDFKTIKSLGVKAVRGPRGMSEALLKEMENDND